MISVSLIVISYNQEKYIEETLKGILSQTVKPMEVIVADDGSSDSTQEIIKDFVHKNGLDNWKLLLSKVNKGITKNLAEAIQTASGEIIMINAGDDISYPNRLKLTIEAFEKHPDYSIVTGDLDVIDSNGRITGEIKNSSPECNDIQKALRNGMPYVHPVGQSFKRDIFDLFGPLPTDVPNEDDQISFRGMISGGILCIPDKLMKYRVHSFSASAWIRNKQNVKFFLERFISDMPVRKRHMELWKEALEKTTFSKNYKYLNLLDNKIKVYDYFCKFISLNFIKRLAFTLKYFSFMNKKEVFYSVLGKYGIYIWRYARNVIKG